MTRERSQASEGSKPHLPKHVRLYFDETRHRYAVLAPERVYWPDETAVEVLKLCDGRRTIADIAARLANDYAAPEDLIRADVLDFIQSWLDLRLLTTAPSSVTSPSSRRGQGAEGTREPFEQESASHAERPLGLLAELTHRCPLQCPYCSNPVQLLKAADELDTRTWLSVFSQAADLGVLQVHLSGGEPTLRHDLEDLVSALSARGVYTNLITAGVTLTPERMNRLADCGLDHVQLSFQALDPEVSDKLGNTKRSLDKKLTAARFIQDAGLPLTINAPTHRHNIGQAAALIDLAVELGADRLEIAHVQYYGWAARNRAALLPPFESVLLEAAIIGEAKERLKGVLNIDYVTPDYYAQFPKPCMGGWAKDVITITPEGKALPCHAAASLPLPFDSVKEKPLSAIWYDSVTFNRFRGLDWMKEPCRSCPRQEVDFGGCRCQAFALTGDPAAADPACSLSPHHHLMAELAEAASSVEPPPFIYRRIAGGPASGDDAFAMAQSEAAIAWRRD